MPLTTHVAFITGQSDPSSCALSPEQGAFLDALQAPGVVTVRRNFPYELVTPPYRDVPIVSASWHNTRQYFRSHIASCEVAHRSAVVGMCTRAGRTVLLAGSCGLDLLTSLSLPRTVLERLHVFAYGPVSRRRPDCEVFVVRGRCDWLSLVLGGRCDRIVRGGHMGYLREPEVLALCRTFVAGVAALGGGVR